MQLRLVDVGRVFGGEVSTTALSAVSLDINAGEFVVIEGPSGGGKSTLLNIIGLLDHPSSGTYLVDDLDTSRLSERELAELRSDTFAFVFQSFHLLDRRPSIDSVELNLLYRGVAPSARREAALRAMDRLGIGHLAWRRANLLSGGERQRVAIARALATGAPVVVADEPTGNLDTANSAQVIEALRTLSREGVTIVLVTHDSDVAATADRRVRIRDGQLEAGPASAPMSAVTHPSSLPGKPSKLRRVDAIRDAFISVLSRLSRTVGLASAVAVAVALAVGTLGVAASAQAQVSDTFDAHASHDVTLTWTNQAIDVATPAREAMVQRVKRLTGVNAAVAIDEYGNQEIVGVPGRDALAISSYRFIGDVLDASRISVSWTPGHKHVVSPGEALVGSNLASQLGLGPRVAGPVVLLEGQPVAIAGVVNSSPRLPQLMGSIIVNGDPAVAIDRTMVLILAKPGAAGEVGRQAPLAVDPVRFGDISVTLPVDPNTARAQIETDVFNALIAFTVLALIAAIVALANAMVSSVLERRQEFGLRRAVGARRIHVGLLVLIEACIIGLAGGFVGLIVGFGAVLAMTISRHWSPIFDVRLAPVAIVGGVVAGVVGGIVASVRAARIEPAEALRL